jgi:23S rRNA (uracil1939-C5)-methyltransferase
VGPFLRHGSRLKHWTIEKLVPGGAGMCRLPDGSVGFVEGAFPGDRVKPLELVKKKDYARATRFELVQPSPERVPAVCPVVDACGGCDWMKLERSAELREKANVVAQALERTGGVRLAAVPEVITAGAELGYRSRVRLHVDGRGRVGFYARGTHTLVEVPGCPVAEPAVERGIACVRALADEAPRALARFESVDVRSNEAGGLTFVARPRDVTTSREGLARDEAFVLERLRAHGSALISAETPEFSQVNRAVNAALVAHVVDGAVARGARTFLDLYAGSGNFGVPLARAGMSGIGVESDASSAARARERAEAEAPGKLRVLTKDVKSGLLELVRAKRAFELAVLDPPRAGAKEALAGLVALAPPAIAYVACDPVTLARDVRALREQGWDVARVTCFDMFPKTHHVETLVWLERRAPSA